MSITLGDYNVETKKTVGDLPAGVDNILATPPCDTSADLANFQPKWKKLTEFDFVFNSTPSGLNYVIDKRLIGGRNVDLTPYLSKLLVNGYDYRVTVNLNFPTVTPVVGVMNFCYDYQAPNGINLFDLGGFTSGSQVHLSQGGVSGDYSLGTQLLAFYYQDTNPFSLEINLEIHQLLSAKWDIELCGGGSVSHIADSEFETITEEVLYTEDPEVEPERINREVVKRKTTYDPANLGFAELAKIPTTCTTYSVYYISYALQEGTDKFFYIDTVEDRIKLSSAIFPAGIYEFRLTDGVNTLFSGNCGIDGIIDWTDWMLSGLATTRNLEFQVWDGLFPVTSVFDTIINIRYDYTTYDCPCVCDTDCGEITIKFYQNCGNIYALKFNLSVQQGKYDIEGETFKQGDSIIRPITNIKSNYDLVINEYSDEAFLLLMELISDNIQIGIIDNIDPSEPETLYYINTDALTPEWQFNSKLGSLSIPIIKSNTIKTKRRNCCN